MTDALAAPPTTAITFAIRTTWKAIRIASPPKRFANVVGLLHLYTSCHAVANPPLRPWPASRRLQHHFLSLIATGSQYTC